MESIDCLLKQTFEKTVPTLNINGQRRKLRNIDIINIPTHDKWRGKRTRGGSLGLYEKYRKRVFRNMHYSISNCICVYNLCWYSFILDKANEKTRRHANILEIPFKEMKNYETS